MVDEDTPPETLESRTVEAVAKFIKDGRAQRIVVMVSSPPQGCKLSLTLCRQAQASVRPPVYLIFGRQTPVSMQTSHA